MREGSAVGMTDSARCGTADREAELISPEVADSLAVHLLGDLRRRTGGLLGRRMRTELRRRSTRHG